MKKLLITKFYISIIFTILISQFCLPSISFSDEVIIQGNFKKAPKIFLDENSKPKGILFEIAELISQETGDHFKYKLASWARAYQQASNAKNGNIGIIGIKKNAERLKIFDFSEPIYYDPNYLVVLKNKNYKINKIENLKGLRVGYNRGAYFGPEFEKAKQFFIDSADTHNKTRLLKLLKGRIDAAFIGGPGRVGLNMALKQHEELRANSDKFTLLPLEFTVPDHIAFTKALNKKKYIETLNKVILKLHKNGSIQKIVDKYSS